MSPSHFQRHLSLLCQPGAGLSLAGADAGTLQDRPGTCLISLPSCLSPITRTPSQRIGAARSRSNPSLHQYLSNLSRLHTAAHLKHLTRCYCSHSPSSRRMQNAPAFSRPGRRRRRVRCWECIVWGTIRFINPQPASPCCDTGQPLSVLAQYESPGCPCCSLLHLPPSSVSRPWDQTRAIAEGSHGGNRGCMSNTVLGAPITDGWLCARMLRC